MQILNLGSLNLDRVYSVRHFVGAGETILSDKCETFCGGKGLNQSIALSRAGAQVCHAGAIGKDGEALRTLLKQAGVELQYLQQTDTFSGHAVIQLTPEGQNSIIVCGGANSGITEAYIDEVLSHFSAGDILLMQNETANVAYTMHKAKSRGLLVAFNASPITESLHAYPLHLVDYFLVNEVEGKALSNSEASGNEEILEALCCRFPSAAIVLTVGKEGVYYERGGCREQHGIYNVPVVDTTAAGDTFCGYFIAGVAKGLTVKKTLRYASLASSLTVSKKGAAASIPTWDEVSKFGKSFQLVR